MPVQKTLHRQALTLAHGRFRLRQVVYVCDQRCERGGSRVTRRSPALTELVPPKSTVGYDLLVYVGVERFVVHRQREEIRAALAKEHGIHLSSGEISELGQRFLIYLEALHRDSAPALRAALASDGGWPLHVDATGEDGRGTLLVALAGWRRWVLGAWKIPTERAEAIQPKLEQVAAQFGPPGAILRDLGRAVTEAASGLVIPIRVQVETNDPGPRGQTAEAIRVAGHAGQALLQWPDHRVQVVEHSVRELLFAQFIPDVFLRIQLGRIGRQGKQADVIGNDEFLGFVRAGSIYDHDNQFGRVSLADLGEELSHAESVHLPAQPPIQLPLQWADRAVDVNKLAFLAITDHRPQRSRRPAPPGSHHASKASLVLKHQAHRAARWPLGPQHGSQRFGKFFFHSAWAAGSLFG